MLKILFGLWVVKSAEYLNDFGDGLSELIREHPVQSVEMDEEYTWVLLNDRNKGQKK